MALPRARTTHDYGIDAHVEIVDNQRPTGKLIALQIKAGLSFFEEEANEAYILRTNDKHIAYWVGHSMPVVLVLFNPETNQRLLAARFPTNSRDDGEGLEIVVPKLSLFEEPTRHLKALAAFPDTTAGTLH